MSSAPGARPPRPRPLTLVREVRRGEARLMLEGACHHSGDITVNKVVRDLSDVETAYGKCGCGAWVIRTTWFGSRDAECYETRMMSPREVETLIGPTMPVESEDARERRADWLHEFQLTNGQ